MIRSALSFYLLLYSGLVSAQLFQPPSYPSKEFRNPLDIPISLAANFGEIRLNHYHMGLDIRTEHRENLPVYAAADGYIFRIKIEPFGFGQAIYIRHTNGFISVYAHLNSFYPALASYVKQKQYELERWDISMELPPDLLIVKKGDLIAFSGNMGGSQGPHLHFEIRSFPDDINLNPMLFGLPITDNTSPVIRSLSAYDLNKSFYEQTPSFIPVKGNFGRYTIIRDVLILNTPNPGFGISGFDTQSGSKNPNGIFQGIIYDNGEAVSGFRMDRISYIETRGINANIDYPTHQRGGPYYQLLFKMPGYSHSIYHEAKTGGHLHLEDGKLHLIRIELKDPYGNSSNLIFKVRYQPEEKKIAVFPGKIFYPGMVDGYETPDVAFYLGEKCLYDSVHLVYQEIPGPDSDIVSATHHFGSKQIPLADTMTVRIRLSYPVSQKERILMQWTDGEDFEVEKPEWLGDWATASFWNFGNFRLVLDTIPPVISIPGVVENANLQRSTRIAVTVQDNNKKIKNFRGTLDGKWLMFTNDKARAFIYHFDENCKPGNHELKIYAEDEAGNSATRVLHFVR
ncbi:MAG TPA: M23 family metallopeptidase [Puia sp.]|nr:M23 family metallopeptidase [Puia sp.]